MIYFLVSCLALFFKLHCNGCLWSQVTIGTSNGLQIAITWANITEIYVTIWRHQVTARQALAMSGLNNRVIYGYELSYYVFHGFSTITYMLILGAAVAFTYRQCCYTLSYQRYMGTLCLKELTPLYGWLYCSNHEPWRGAWNLCLQFSDTSLWFRFGFQPSLVYLCDFFTHVIYVISSLIPEYHEIVQIAMKGDVKDIS